ncbi:MAG: diguanylate cyclase (GGDEF)-like protein/PAS domain S-box-containing protein [Flavobacteriales bacterium]|jgi:diguanylate cyclase (GGDEF)-like protein/PAS domain S-box-containing protein
MPQTRVLVVDDQALDREALAGMLGDQSFDIDMASSGHEALRMTREQDYALVLMDVVMPEMGGFECVDLMRQTLTRRPPAVIFITATQTNQECIHKGYALGAVDYLIKPVNENTLVQKVLAFTSLYESQQHLEMARQEADSAKKHSERLLNHTADGIIAVDKQGDITFANVAACTLLTTTVDRLIGSNIKEIVSPNSREEDWRRGDFCKIFEDGQCNQVSDEDFWRNPQTPFSVQYTQATVFDDLMPIGGVISFQDINERKLTEYKLIALAHYDQLTGLINRATFWETLEANIKRARRNNFEVQVLFIDLDHFKEVNDTLGHDAGDRLLIESANRIRASLRNTDIACRMGGDEFAIVLIQPNGLGEGQVVGEKIIASICQPININNKSVYVGASIGVSSFPRDGDNAASVTRAADMAMYSAKKSGRNCVRYFDQNIQRNLDEKNEIADGLRHAIEKDELKFFYQPQYEIRSQKLSGFEALMRWEHPTKGFISPEIFIPIAEDSGIIEQLGDWTFREVIRQTKIWYDRSITDDKWSVSINVSPKQLKQEGFAERFSMLIQESGLPNGFIDIELTETAVMEDPESSIKELGGIRDKGILVYVDDFGTGYSSLIYLNKLPIDVLKIDKSFVEDIGKDESDEAIVKSIIMLAHTLKLKVIAEGVETTQQLEFLTKLDCDIAQGYLFSRPVCVSDATEILLKAEVIR